MSRGIRAAPEAHEAPRFTLDEAAVLFTGAEKAAGCLMASSVATSSDAAARVRDAIAAMRRQTAEALRRRTKRDVRDGLLGAATDAAALADIDNAVMNGMSASARDGTPRAGLRAFATSALAAWPIDKS